MIGDPRYYEFVQIFAKICLTRKIFKTKSTDPPTITNLLIIILTEICDKA